MRGSVGAWSVERKLSGKSGLCELRKTVETVERSSGAWGHLAEARC
jgi:hypothetical protein